MNDLENTADPLSHQQLSDPTPVSLHFNQAGHSINDVILIALEIIRCGEKGSKSSFNTQREQSVFLLSHFQILICNELLVLFSFFFQPLKKVCFQTEILDSLFKYIFFCFSFCLLLHHLAVRISLPFHIFLNKIGLERRNEKRA